MERREVLNILWSLHRSGCQWDMLPHDLLPKGTVYDPFTPWRDAGTWAKVVPALRERTLVAAGRAPTPSSACIDITGCKFSAAQMLRSSAQREGDGIRRERYAKKNAGDSEPA